MKKVNEVDNQVHELKVRRRIDPENAEDKADHQVFNIVYEDQKIRFLENKFDKKALEAFRCRCLVCVKASERQLILFINNLRLSKILKVKNTGICKPMSNKEIETVNNNPKKPKLIERDFVFILRRLVPPARAQRSLNINIPDTVCFIGGDPRLIIYSLRDKKTGIPTIKCVRQKEKLTLTQIRTDMNDRRYIKNSFNQRNRKKYRD